MKLFIILFLSLTCSYAPATDYYINCADDPIKQNLRSKELQKIVAADQAERMPPVDWIQLPFEDEQRRKRVAEIFAEGCFFNALDYYAGALVFQHGNHADHFFQTFLWAKKSSEMGLERAKSLIALGVDRHLVKVGKKQLFGSQAYKSDEKACWCLGQTEPTFTDSMRLLYTNKTLANQENWIKELNQKDESCQDVVYCSNTLLPTPKGSILGFW